MPQMCSVHRFWWCWVRVIHCRGDWCLSWWKQRACWWTVAVKEAIKLTKEVFQAWLAEVSSKAPRGYQEARRKPQLWRQELRCGGTSGKDTEKDFQSASKKQIVRQRKWRYGMVWENCWPTLGIHFKELLTPATTSLWEETSLMTCGGD